jgi:ribonucleotide monophosphatase NagD (HAD superfamily)
MKSEIRRLAAALKTTSSEAHATIVANYLAQVRIFSDGLTKLREELQNLDIEIARQKRSGSDEAGGAALAIPDENALRLKLDRTLAKRAHLKKSVDALAQRKVGWVEGERLIQVPEYAKEAWLAARRELDTELARIDAGQMEARQAAANAIQAIKREQRNLAQQSEILDNQRHERSTRHNLPR